MTETSINLGCAKINIKRDKYQYAPPDIVNPQIFNPIPANAEVYKISPSTTFFFKKTSCKNINFGWHKRTKIQNKENNMYKHLPSKKFFQSTSFQSTSNEFEYLYNHPLYKQYLSRTWGTPDLCFRNAIPGHRWSSYVVYYRDTNSASFIEHLTWPEIFKKYVLSKEVRKFSDKENKAAPQDLDFWRQTDTIKRSEKRLAQLFKNRETQEKKDAEKIWNKISSFFKTSNRPKAKPKANEIIMQPSAPAYPQPSYNADYGQATTVTNINNININIVCNLL